MALTIIGFAIEEEKPLGPVHSKVRPVCEISKLAFNTKLPLAQSEFRIKLAVGLKVGNLTGSNWKGAEVLVHPLTVTESV